MCSQHIEALEPDRFHARLRALQCGAAHLSAMSYGPLVARRTPALVRRSDPETLTLALSTEGKQGIEQLRSNALLAPGEMVLYDSSAPFTATAHASGTGRSAAMIVQLPKALVPFSEQKVRRLIATPLNHQGTMGRLLTAFLQELSRSHPGTTARDAARLGNPLVDLVAAFLAHHMDDGTALPSGPRQRVLLLRVKDYIHRHLAHSELTPASIANTHGISLRYLHCLFEQHEMTVTAYIRRLRLDRCRRDLSDPAWDHLTVQSVGARWGFTRPSDFSRAFRADTGMPPGAYRSRRSGRSSRATDEPDATQPSVQTRSAGH
ncbi:helix-turn-helix domain-containing protein [Streptomyces sp. ARC32]